MVNFTTRIETACVISHAKRHNAIGVKLVYLQSSILFQDSAGKTCYQICLNSSVSWKHSNAETVIVYVEILLMKCSNISINIPLYKYFLDLNLDNCYSIYPNCSKTLICCFLSKVWIEDNHTLNLDCFRRFFMAAQGHTWYCNI